MVVTSNTTTDCSKSLLVIDGHFDILSDVAKKRKSGEIKVIENEYLSELHAGGVDIIVASIFVDSLYLPEMALRQALEQVNALYNEVYESPEKIMICRTVEDIYEAKAQGKVGFVMSFEGAEPLCTDTGLLRSFYELGVRGLGLAWSRRNSAADGCSYTGSIHKAGLTEFGIELVKEAERLGMFIDVSHLCDEGLADVLEYTTKPFVASHSNARAIANSMRNLTDEHLKAMAARDCVIGINACSIITSDTDEDATLENLLNHVDHIVRIAGIDHVALGFDLCDKFMSSFSEEIRTKMPRVPFDIIKGHDKTGEFLEALSARGYSEKDIYKIAGENLIHLYKKVLKQ